jgi:hypothetical protein
MSWGIGPVCAVHLVDFRRPAVVLNLKQPAEILAKKPKNRQQPFTNSRIAGKKQIILKLKHTVYIRKPERSGFRMVDFGWSRPFECRTI